MAFDPLSSIGWAQLHAEARNVAQRQAKRGWRGVYGIPAGGCAPAALVASELGIPVVDSPEGNFMIPEAKVLVIDDLIDSGTTAKQFPARRFDAFYRKPHSPKSHAPYARERDGWLTFPWEAKSAGPEDAVVRLLEWIGEDPNRNGLIDTPKRVVKALRQMTEGYRTDPFEPLSVTFEEDCDQMIVLSNIAFSSMCEHHMLPFIGTATVGYIPNGPIVGLSKLARVVDAYAQRLQVQERLTDQIADAIEQALSPKGVGVILTAHHACMGLRGVKKSDARMTTSSLRGDMRSDGVARAEFMALHSP